MDTLVADLRHAARSLARTPGSRSPRSPRSPSASAPPPPSSPSSMASCCGRSPTPSRTDWCACPSEHPGAERPAPRRCSATSPGTRGESRRTHRDARRLLRRDATRSASANEIDAHRRRLGLAVAVPPAARAARARPLLPRGARPRPISTRRRPRSRVCGKRSSAARPTPSAATLVIDGTPTRSSASRRRLRLPSARRAALGAVRDATGDAGNAGRKRQRLLRLARLRGRDARTGRGRRHGGLRAACRARSSPTCCSARAAPVEVTARPMVDEMT